MWVSFHPLLRGGSASEGTWPLHSRSFDRLHLSTTEGSLIDSRLRASNEHIPIVRAPGAGGRPGYPSPSSDASVVRAQETNRQPVPIYLNHVFVDCEAVSNCRVLGKPH